MQKLLKFLGVALTAYGILFALIEPLGLFGLDKYPERLGLWGYLILIVPSASVAYCVIYLRDHVALLRTKLIPPIDVRQVTSPSGAVMLWGKYEVVRDLYDEALSRLQEVRNKFDGSACLLKTIKRKPSYDRDVIRKLHRAYQGTSVQSRVALPIEVLEDASHFYEVLPHFRGYTLFQLMSMNTVGVLGALLELWAKDLLELIKPLHEFSPKLIHRDINPYNLLVASDDLRLVLLDFSSAVSLERGKSYSIIGCPGFTAPEQRQGKYAPSSDIYSIGALLYYLNSGRWPPTIEDRLYRGVDIYLEEPIRGRLSRAIHKMYALEPTERFQHAAEALEFISKHYTTELLSLKPVGTLQLPDGGQIIMSRHDWKWVR